MFSALHPPLVQGPCRVSRPSFSDGAGMLGMSQICFQGTFPHGTANEQEHFPLPCNKAGALPPRGLPGAFGSWLQRGAVSLVVQPLVGDGWCQLASQPGNRAQQRGAATTWWTRAVFFSWHQSRHPKALPCVARATSDAQVVPLIPEHLWGIYGSGVRQGVMADGSSHSLPCPQRGQRLTGVWMSICTSAKSNIWGTQMMENSSGIIRRTCRTRP